jgi:hypothetical protein
MKLTTEEIALCVMGLQSIHVSGHEKVRAALEERMKLELESRSIFMDVRKHNRIPLKGLSVTSRTAT